MTFKSGTEDDDNSPDKARGFRRLEQQGQDIFHIRVSSEDQDSEVKVALSQQTEEIQGYLQEHDKRLDSDGTV